MHSLRSPQLQHPFRTRIVSGAISGPAYLACIGCVLGGLAGSAWGYEAGVSAQAVIGESDPNPDEQEQFNTGPVSVVAQRVTSDAITQATAQVGNHNTLKVRARTETLTTEFTEGGPHQGSALAEVTDTVRFDRNGQPISAQQVRFSLHYSGNVSATGGGGAGAEALYTIIIGDGLGPIQEDTGEPGPLLFLELGPDGQFSFTESEDVLDIPDLGGAGLPVSYSLWAGVGGGVQVSVADADVSNSATLQIQALDEFGNVDPTVNVTGETGIDYTTVVPEPASAALLALGGLALLRRAARSS